MKRPKIGDLYTIATLKGTYYFQYTHKHNMFGYLIRAFDGVGLEVSDKVDEILNLPVRFSCFYTHYHAVRDGHVKLVGNYPIRSDLVEFPVFRSGIPTRRKGKIDIWHLWDGNDYTLVGSLTEEQKYLPILGVANIALVRERLDSGWRPEIDATT